MDESIYWARRHVSRRGLIRGGGLGLMGLAGAALLGCSGDDADTPAGSSTATTIAGGGSAAATATGEASGVKYGGTLLTGSADDPNELDPHLGVLALEYKYWIPMSEGIVALDNRGAPDPTRSLAEKWEVVDDTTLVFTLRQGVTFHDGEPLNTEAVKANWDRVSNPDTNSQGISVLRSVTGFEATDDLTFRVTLDAPNAGFLANLSDRAGQILSPKSFVDGAAKPEGPVGTGPFMFGEWVRGSVVKLVKNPNYWRKDAAGNALPYLDGIDLLTILDGNVREASLESGDLHITQPQFSRLQTIRSEGKWQVASGPTGWNGGRFNTALAPTDDSRFRRALGFALDRDAENAAIFYGSQRVEPRMGPIPPGYAWCYPGEVPDAPTYDPAEAVKLITAIYGTGAVPSFTAVNNDPDSVQRAALWGDMFQRIGVPMDFQLRPDSSEVFQVKKEANASLPAGFSLRPDVDGLLYLTLHSAGTSNAGGRTDGPWAEIDAAIVAGRSTYVEEERREIYKNLSKMVTDEYPQIYTSYRETYEMASQNVGGFMEQFTSDGKPRYSELWLS